MTARQDPAFMRYQTGATLADRPLPTDPSLMVGDRWQRRQGETIYTLGLDAFGAKIWIESGGSNIGAESATLYVDPVGGNDAWPGTQAKPFLTLRHALNVAPMITRQGVLIKCLAGTLETLDAPIWWGSYGSTGEGQPGREPALWIEGALVQTNAFTTSGPSDGFGRSVPTGVAAAIDAYRGLLLEFVASTDLFLVGKRVRVLGNDANGVLFLGEPWGFVPAGTDIKLLQDATIQPVAEGFAIFAGRTVYWDWGMVMRMDPGVYVEAYAPDGAGSLVVSGVIEGAVGSGFNGLGMFDCSLRLQDGVLRSALLAPFILAGNPTVWDRNLRFRSSVITGTFVLATNGQLGSHFSDWVECEIAAGAGNSGQWVSSTLRRTLGGPVPITLGGCNWIFEGNPFEGENVITEWDDCGVSLNSGANVDATSLQGASVTNPAGVGVRIYNGRITHNFGPGLTITGAAGDFAMSGTVYPWAATFAYPGLSSLSTLSWVGPTV